MILLTAMEHLREDSNEYEEAPTKTSSSGEVETRMRAWPEAHTGNWSQHIRTFGERKSNPETRKLIAFFFQRRRFCLDSSFWLDLYTLPLQQPSILIRMNRICTIRDLSCYLRLG